MRLYFLLDLLLCLCFLLGYHPQDLIHFSIHFLRSSSIRIPNGAAPYSQSSLKLEHQVIICFPRQDNRNFCPSFQSNYRIIHGPLLNSLLPKVSKLALLRLLLLLVLHHIVSLIMFEAFPSSCLF